MAGNALQIELPPDDGNPLASRYAEGGAVAETVPAVFDRVGQWLAEQRAKSVKMGLLNPETGLPTFGGLLDALQQYTGTFERGIGSIRLPRAHVDARGPNNALGDPSMRMAKAVEKSIVEHEATPGSIDLYGAEPRKVTLPEGVTKPADIAARQQGMVDAATATTVDVPPGTTPARYWYQAGADAMHNATGRDLPATERVVAAHAVTSPQTDVAGNANFAVNAYNQSLLGHPIDVKSGQANQALEEVLYGGTLPASRKVGPFFENHVRYLDPKWADNLTNDIWQMRQAGFKNADGSPYSGTPGVGEDNYVRMMVDKATRKLNDEKVDGGGWTPDQVQASLWVHHKLMTETGKSVPASFNFMNALERLTTRQEGAHRAGSSMLGQAAHDPAAQGAFQQEARGLLTDPHGRDIVNHSLGLLTPPNQPGAAVVSITADGMKPSSRTLMDASTLIRASLLRHPDALWAAHPSVKGEPNLDSSSSVLSFHGDPADHASVLKAALDKAGGGLERSVLMKAPEGVRVLNISELTGLSNKEFQAALKNATKGAGLTADMQRVRTEYGYHAHDWDKDPSGSGYISKLGELPGHLQRVGDQLFAQLGGRLDAAASKVSGSNGRTGPWRTPGFAQAVGPELELPIRQWQQRPSPNDPGSRLPNLLLQR